MSAVYGSRLSEVYDTIYAHGKAKDYAAEAAAVAGLVRARMPVRHIRLRVDHDHDVKVGARGPGVCEYAAGQHRPPRCAEQHLDHVQRHHYRVVHAQSLPKSATLARMRFLRGVSRDRCAHELPRRSVVCRPHLG